MKRFGRLVVVRELRRYKKAGEAQFYRKVVCKCDCGESVKVQCSNLKRGSTKSCGCWRVDSGIANGKATRRHGHSRFGKLKRCSVEYNAFSNAKGRCRNPNNKDYSDYGGRGIKFLFASFEQFYAAVGAKPSPQHSLGRIDGDKHYAPGNVEWQTIEQQVAERDSRKKKS